MSDSDSVSPGRCDAGRNFASAAFTVPPLLAQQLWRRRRVDDVTVTVDHLREAAPDPSGIERSVDTWVAMCEGALKVSGGERTGRMMVRTDVFADSTPGDGAIGDVLETVGS